MAGSLILALDQGTTSSRAVLYGLDGAVRGIGQAIFGQHFPRSGWVEHDASEIWSSQWNSVLQALKAAEASSGEVAAVGITNQRETIVLWERTSGRALAPAIVWQDRRTAEWLRKLPPQSASVVTSVTGLLLDPYFSASKLAWLLDSIPGARSRATRGELAAGTIDSWLLWNLTKGAIHATDVSNASRTSLFDTQLLDWSEEMLKLFGIPREVLPKVVSSIGFIGECNCEGLCAPVTGMAGDQQAALFGQLCHQAGGSKCTYGTGCFLLRNTGRIRPVSKNRLLSTIAWQQSGREVCYALEGSVFTGGSAIQWLRDGLGIISRSDEVGSLADSVPDSGGVEVVPAFTGLGAPWWDPHARGAILGLSRGSTAAHIARATVESIALQVADLIDCMADRSSPEGKLRVDGGACQCDLLMQSQADLLGISVERPANLETTAVGAAMMAGLGAGIWREGAGLAHLRSVDRVFEPQRSRDWALTRRASWKRAVERSRHWTGGDQ